MFRIADGRDSFYQWDIDRKIIVSDSTIKEVHFCNKTDDCALVTEVYEENGQRLANVPNILLQDSWRIRVYAYCGDCYTKHEVTFKVNPRSKPADYVYTETEVKKWEDIEKRCNEILEIAGSISQGGVLPVVANNYEELVAAFNSVTSDRYIIGQNIYVVTVNVPDLWVMEVTEEAVAYTYDSDEAFVNEIVQNGYVQVGYYKLAQLETKGNLIDYAKKEDVENKLDKITSTGLIKLYGVNSNGQQSTYAVGSSVGAIEEGRIAQYFGINNIQGDSQPPACLLTRTPEKPYQAVNKNYLDTELDKKVSKATPTANATYAYSVVKQNENIYENITEISPSAKVNTVPLRGANGNFWVGEPTVGGHCATKNYVDNAIAALRAELGLE